MLLVFFYSCFTSGLAGTASSGAACRAGFATPFSLPRRFCSRAALTQSPTSLSDVSGKAAALAALAGPRFRFCKPTAVARSAPELAAASASASASASSDIVGGFRRGSSQG